MAIRTYKTGPKFDDIFFSTKHRNFDDTSKYEQSTLCYK